MSYCYERGIPHSEFMEWEPSDRSKVLAWKMEESAKCSMCGTGKHEWDEDRYAYEPVQQMCHGCYLKDIASETEHTLPGVTVVLLPKDAVTEEMRQGGRFS